MLASPLYLRGNCKSSRTPTASGKPAAMIQDQVQSVLKGKLDVKFALKNRELSGNQMQCFHQEAKNRET